MNKRIFLIVSSAVFFLGNNLMASATYSIPTNDESISCQLVTLNLAETGRFLEGTSEPRKKIFQVILEKTYKKIMPVKVTITNASAYPLVLHKDDYLKEIFHNNAYIPKEEILTKFSHLTPTILMAVASLFALSVPIGCWNIKTDLSGEPFVESDRSAAKKLWANRIFYTFFGACCTVGGYYCYRKINRIKKNFLTVQQGTHIHKFGQPPQKEELFEADQATFIIPPGYIFEDLFFVDLSHASRDFFDKNPQTFCYSLEDGKEASFIEPEALTALQDDHSTTN